VIAAQSFANDGKSLVKPPSDRQIDIHFVNSELTLADCINREETTKAVKENLLYSVEFKSFKSLGKFSISIVLESHFHIQQFYFRKVFYTFLP